MNFNRDDQNSYQTMTMKNKFDAASTVKYAMETLVVATPETLQVKSIKREPETNNVTTGRQSSIRSPFNK